MKWKWRDHETDKEDNVFDKETDAKEILERLLDFEERWKEDNLKEYLLDV